MAYDKTPQETDVVSDDIVEELNSNLSNNQNELNNLTKKADDVSNQYQQAPLPPEPPVMPMEDADEAAYEEAQAYQAAMNRGKADRLTQPGMPREAKNQVASTTSQLHHAVDDIPQAGLQADHMDPTVSVTPTTPMAGKTKKGTLSKAARKAVVAAMVKQREQKRRELQRKREQQRQQELANQQNNDQRKNRTKDRDRDVKQRAVDVEQNHQRQTRNRRVDAEKTPNTVKNTDQQNRPVNSTGMTREEYRDQSQNNPDAQNRQQTGSSTKHSVTNAVVVTGAAALAARYANAAKHYQQRERQLNQQIKQQDDYIKRLQVALTTDESSMNDKQKMDTLSSLKADTKTEIPHDGGFHASVQSELQKTLIQKRLLKQRQNQYQQAQSNASEIANGFNKVAVGKDKDNKILDVTQKQADDFNKKLQADSRSFNKQVDNMMSLKGRYTAAMRYINNNQAGSLNPTMVTGNKEQLAHLNQLKEMNVKQFAGEVKDNAKHVDSMFASAKSMQKDAQHEYDLANKLNQDAVKFDPKAVSSQAQETRTKVAEDNAKNLTQQTIDKQVYGKPYSNHQSTQAEPEKGVDMPNDPTDFVKFDNQMKKDLPIVAPKIEPATVSRGAAVNSNVERAGINGKDTQVSDSMHEKAGSTAKAISDAGADAWKKQLEAQQQQFAKMMETQNKLLKQQQEMLEKLSQKLTQADEIKQEPKESFVDKFKKSMNERHDRMKDVNSKDLMFEGAYRAGSLAIHVAKDVALAAGAITAGVLFAGGRAAKNAGKRMQSKLDQAMLNTVDDPAAKNKAAGESQLAL